MKIKTTNFLISLLLCFMFAVAQTIAQNIIFIEDTGRPNDDDDQIEFLEAQGFSVERFWPGRLGAAGQDTIDKLNAADLIIVGRSPHSSNFQDSADRVAWNAVTAPLILNGQYLARNNRLNWFNSGTADHRNTVPFVAYANVAAPGDPIFANAVLDGDSMAWCLPPHDFIFVTEPSNGVILATWQGNPLVARFTANVPFYAGAADSAAGPRTYFGFGNDAVNFDNPNFFPLTKNAKTVYLAEICRMLGIPIVEPDFRASDNRILFIEDAARDNDDDDQIDFLETQGFTVERFWPGRLGAAGQDTIDKLNAADLVIVGRSPHSSNFQDSIDRVAWNAVTAPLLMNGQYLVRNNRLNWFNSGTADHRNTVPFVAYANIAAPGDPIFANAVLDGDSMAWCVPPHDFIFVTEPSNGDILATWEGNPLVARFAADVPFYAGAADSAAGPRTYFGFGNDAVNFDNPNFFPLTKNAKTVYLAEISRMLDMPIEVPDYRASDNRILFIEDAARDNDDDDQIDFLETQGFTVERFWPGRLGAAGQDTINKLNAADLVIVGRSPHSSNFQDSIDRVAWNAVTAPLLMNGQYLVRNNRLNWFNSGTADHRNTVPFVAYANIAAPGDPIFANAVLDGDSMAWCVPPHDFIFVTEPSNGEILATWEGNPLVARFTANVPFYAGAADSAAGPRTYFGFGNDAVNFDNPNFFPLTKNAKTVYLAEISRMLDMAIVEPDFRTADNRIIYVAPLDLMREVPNRTFLANNGFKVEHFWPGDDITLAGQDTIDKLNAADLVLIGRSGPSASFQEEKAVWNGLTAPVMLICQWKARSTRLNWFNSTDVPNSTGIVMGTADMPNDVIFSNVTLDGEDMMEWSVGPNDIMRISPVATPTSGEVVASYNDSLLLVVRFEPGVEFWPGAGDMPAGPRSYFGMGADGNGYNFFPLLDGAQQVYLNEICRMVGLGVQDVVISSTDATLSAIEYDAATAVFDPAFDPAVTSYTLTLTEEPNTVTVTGVANDPDAAVTGGGLIDVTDLESQNVNLVCRAVSGNQLTYRVTVQPYIEEAIEEVISSHINMFPNPVNDILSITSVNPKVRITIYNAVGQLVMEHNADNNLIQLDVSNLDAGVYLIRMEDSENTLVGKFCKE